MLKRMLIMLVTVGIVIGALGFIKYRQIKIAIAQGSAYKPPPETVTTVVVSKNQWQTTLNSIGTITAAQGVVLSADLPGTVAKINFESGKRVNAGDVLVELDMRQEKARLDGALAQQHVVHINLERAQKLHSSGAISQADLDMALAQDEQADASVNEIRSTIERKTIRAPFSGLLGIRQINLGQYVNSGDPIVPLQALDPVYVDFSIPQQELANIKVGDRLEVTTDGIDGIAGSGQISAINSQVDQSTRNIDVRATLPNPDRRLYPGMFVQASVSVGKSATVIAVPASSISYTPYGDFVFIVDKVQGPDGVTYKGVKQQLVKLGDSRGDQVAITDGIKLGQEIVTSGVFKLRSGAAVVVNNQIQPSNNPTPKPEEN